MTYHAPQSNAAPRSEPLPYAALDERAAYGPLPHSGVGIAAFGLSLVTALGMVATLVLAMTVRIQARGQGSIAIDDTRFEGMVCSGVSTLLLAVLGILLGLFGCNRKDRSKRFGLLALLLSGLTILVLGLTYLLSDPLVVYRTSPYGMLGL